MDGDTLRVGTTRAPWRRLPWRRDARAAFRQRQRRGIFVAPKPQTNFSPLGAASSGHFSDDVAPGGA
jgi:hypothetical protein